jgi:hypothetical protein
MEMYLLRGFEVSSSREFLPDPALCKTEQEAQAFCKEHCSDSVLYSYVKVRVLEVDQTPKEELEYSGPLWVPADSGGAEERA